MTTTPQVNVNLIRAFDGPRHANLEFLWDLVAEHCQKDIRLHVLANPSARLRHSQCLNEIWNTERNRPERYALLTEFDFLPYFGGFLPLDRLTPKAPILACNYATRDPQTLKLAEHDCAGAWYVLIDKENAPKDLDFTDGGPGNDPAGNLIKRLRIDHEKTGTLVAGRDCLPLHYGLSYPMGVHLFWSRHLHDNPNTVVAGCKLGDIQIGHDLAVRNWVRGSPAAFQRLMTKRLACTLA